MSRAMTWIHPVSLVVFAGCQPEATVPEPVDWGRTSNETSTDTVGDSASLDSESEQTGSTTEDAGMGGAGSLPNSAPASGLAATVITSDGEFFQFLTTQSSTLEFSCEWDRSGTLRLISAVELAPYQLALDLKLDTQEAGLFFEEEVAADDQRFDGLLSLNVRLARSGSLHSGPFQAYRFDSGDPVSSECSVSVLPNDAGGIEGSLSCRDLREAELSTDFDPEAPRFVSAQFEFRCKLQ